MRLSRRRHGHLPLRCADTVAAAAAGDASVRVHVVGPATSVDRPPPAGVPQPPPPLLREAHADFAEQVVVDLPDGRVLGPHRAVISGDGTFLHGLVRYFGTTRAREHPMFLHPRVDGPQVQDDVVAVLASRGDGNYYHFLHDVIARLSVLERWRDAPAIDRYYLPQTTRFQRDLAALAGIDGDRIIDSDAAPHLQARRLVVPALPDLDLGHPAWATDALRERLLPAEVAAVPGRCIYVTRGRQRHNRIVLNEDEVLAALAAYDVQVVDPSALTVAEQIRTFAEAELIVAPHGAALANLTFASAGAAVVELFAPDFVQGCYWKLAATVPGLSYRYLVGEGRTSPRRAGLGVSSDILLDVRSLKRVVDGVAPAASSDRRATS
jgi:capsular polysaccharide biosynthesis protein